MKSLKQKRNFNYQQVVNDRLGKLDIESNLDLGQHFLVDSRAIDLLAKSSKPHSTVIEIGAGVGQLTERLAQAAKRVISIEVDNRYRPLLNKLDNKYKNLEIIYADALSVNLEEIVMRANKRGPVQIISSLPYHIIEPLMYLLIDLKIDNAVLVVGENFSDTISSKSTSEKFSKLSVLVQTFFHIHILLNLSKEAFLPKPRTASAIIKLIPKKNEEIESKLSSFLFKKLFLSEKHGYLINHVLGEGLVEFNQLNVAQITKLQARELLQGLPEEILNRSFSQISNIQTKDLFQEVSNMPIV